MGSLDASLFALSMQEFEFTFVNKGVFVEQLFDAQYTFILDSKGRELNIGKEKEMGFSEAQGQRIVFPVSKTYGLICCHSGML